MTSDQNKIGLASFFIQEIICIVHVAILHLFSTSSNGVKSEKSEVVKLEVPPDPSSGHEIQSEPLTLRERIQVVSRKDTTGMPLQDRVNTASLHEVIYVSPKYENKTLFMDETTARILSALLHEMIYLSPKNQKENKVLEDETTAGPFNEPILAVSRKDSVGRDSSGDIVSAHEISSDDVQKRENPRMVTIDMLPGDILFEIFDIYWLDALEHSPLGGRLWTWYTLAQVCQRWRSVLFASSRYLELKVFCTYGSHVREILNSSLDFPVIARYGGSPESKLLTANDEDGIIALLDHPARLFDVQLTATAPIIEKMATMGLQQEPFSVLEYLRLSTRTEHELVLPSEFGGTPGLRTLWMVRVALPSFPRLLSLAQNLVSFQLEEIPSVGYTMEALLIFLPAMTRLQTLRIHFLFPSSHPVLFSMHQPPESRSVLHCLNYIDFHGTSEYLECLLSTIDTPFLKYIHITFFNQLIFHIPQLSQFIRRTETQQSPNQATIHYFGADISVTLSQAGMPHHLTLRILCTQLDWQISSMAEIFEEIYLALFHVEQLNIGAPNVFRSGQDEIYLSQLDFPDLFRQFVNVKRLYLTGEAVLHVAVALGHITGQLAVTVLPKLRDIYVGNHAELASTQNGLAPFIAAREHSTHPVFILSLGVEPSRNLRSHAGLNPTVPAGIRTDIQRSHPILIPEVDVPNTGIRKHLRSNPHLLAVLDFVGFSLDYLNVYLGQESKVSLLLRLAFPPALESRFPWEVVRPSTIPTLVLRNGMVAMYERLGLEWRWETFARMWAQSFTTAAYRNTLSLLRSFLVTGLTTPLLYTFGPQGQSLRIPLEVSSYSIERGQLELAIETIEQGKELIWSGMSELRSSIGRLREVNPDLADRLANLNRALEEIHIPYSADQGDADAFGVAFEELHGLLKRRQEVIRQIRALQGFANFMKTVSFRTLQTAATRGPIIIVNHCRFRCDILIILHDSPPSLIPTDEGFYERASNLASQLKESRPKHGLDSTDHDDVLANVLAGLYKLVGLPVISRLQELGIPEKSRIWWCPTSVFWSLPLHAMGPVPSTDSHELYFSDLYVCSYTPTLCALIPSRRFTTPKTDSRYSLLLVAQPHHSLPGMGRDIQVVQSLPIPVTSLLSERATPSAVVEGLQSHTLVHFACYGTLEAGKPLDAGIILYGGGRITLLDIANTRLPPAEFAFLSACHSAESTDVDEPTEGLNLAAAMQYHGFGSVVGVMSALGDSDAAELSTLFYKSLFARDPSSHDGPLGERSAEALRFAVRKLRKRRGMTLERWVCWVHYGA